VASTFSAIESSSMRLLESGFGVGIAPERAIADPSRSRGRASVLATGVGPLVSVIARPLTVTIGTPVPSRMQRAVKRPTQVSSASDVTSLGVRIFAGHAALRTRPDKLLAPLAKPPPRLVLLAMSPRWASGFSPDMLRSGQGRTSCSRR
jgi:hypothetical protein